MSAQSLSDPSTDTGMQRFDLKVEIKFCWLMAVYINKKYVSERDTIFSIIM